MKDKFKEALPLLNTLEENGFEAYFVGGCVRNKIMQLPIKDIDITTNASPDDIVKIFPKTIPLGIEHGTVIIRHNDQSYEITSFKDHNDVDYNNRKLENDLLHRDFTVNALAMDLNGDIIDYVNGVHAIKSMELKAVESAKKRILEDPLRILRAYRFVSEYNFKLDKELVKTIKSYHHLLFDLPIERISNEFEKLVTGTYCEKALSLMQNHHIFKSLPFFNSIELKESLFVEKNTSYQSLSQFFAHFVIEYNIDIDYIFAKWKTSKQTVHQTKQLIMLFKEYKQNGLSNWLLYNLDYEILSDYLSLLQIYNICFTKEDIVNKKKALPIQIKNEIVFTGKDLLNLFPYKKPGKWLSNILNKIEKKIVEEELENNFESIKDWIICHQHVID